jgi:cytochrome b561
VALYIYLAVAFVLLPLFVPAAILMREPTRRRKWLMSLFVAIGACVAGLLCEAIVRGPVSAKLRPYHVDYGIQIHHGGVIVALYVLACCGALLFSGYRPIVVFGVINLVAVAVIARLTIDGFASVWCGWAAISSGAIVAYMRFGRPLRRVLPTRA